MSSDSETGEALLEPFFLDGSAGRLFCVYHGPADAQSHRANVIYIPPFAEEANKSRKQASMQARALAAQGCAVLMPDLYGTGESDGDFSQANWDIWRDDVIRGVAWLQARSPSNVVLWGLRLGALLAADVLESPGIQASQLLLWQPVIDGRVFMKQFFRLRVAADMMSGGTPSAGSDIQGLLDAGNTVEIAGYEIGPALAARIAATNLGRCTPESLPSVTWMEVLASPDRSMAVVSRKQIDRWQAGGATVQARTVVGEPFWTTPEITVVPELVTETCQSVAGVGQ